MKTTVFISCSGKQSYVVGTALREFLDYIFIGRIDPWMSIHDIDTGVRWAHEVAHMLEIARFGILIVTPENPDSPWLHFEAGALSKKILANHVCPYLFGIGANDILAPLSQFQAVIANEDDTRKLVKTLNRTLDEPLEDQHVNRQFKSYWPRLKKELQNIDQEFAAQFANLRRDIKQSVFQLQDIPTLKENIYFRNIIVGSIARYCSHLKTIGHASPTFSLPYILYPYYLVRLQSELSVTVKALALVDREETFWREPLGERIRKTASEHSTRVFVFQSPSHLREHMVILRQHAIRYNVKVISDLQLKREFADYSYDFSIVGQPQMRLLARYDYDNKSMTNVIRFSADPREISEHEDKLNEIITTAKQVTNDMFKEDSKGENDDAEIEEFIKRVFHPELTPLQKKHVEMSVYVQIDDYDLHEEKHAHYIDMMERMIQICKEHRGADGRKARAIEFGAGTGIFTRRLAHQLENIDITAIEIDWACYKKLIYNIGKIQEESRGRGRGVSITCKYGDSRIYDSDGKARYVFSSFADHHIKPYDKMKYFENIKKNLEQDGLVIVGDEFLPPYDRQDIEDRRRALHAYHGYIIERAKAEGCPEMVMLEEAALKSGLEEIGDFKLSCEEYEQLVSKAGFQFEKEKIGPLGQDDIGGIYVYTMFLQC